MAGFVFETGTGKCIAWFEDSMDARSYSGRKNKQRGKGTHDWANTDLTLADLIELEKDPSKISWTTLNWRTSNK